MFIYLKDMVMDTEGKEGRYFFFLNARNYTHTLGRKGSKVNFSFNANIAIKYKIFLKRKVDG